MRSGSRLALLALLAGLALPATAQDAAPAQAPEQAPAQAPAAQPGGDVAVLDAPKGIAVPDMPIINTQELEGGLKIEDMKIGDGYEVKPGGAVVAHYHGTLKADGKIFDSSFQRGEPIAFPLSGVIQGWQQGVPGMKVGGIRRLTIPAAMGYGERGAGADIPPNSDLVFVIQLVDALQIIDEKVGEGEAASAQCVPVTVHTITAADGTKIESSTAAAPFVWIPGEYQPIQFGIEGMKVGGKRKLIVPKEMNFSNPNLPSARTDNVPVTIDLELIAVRNLPQGPGGR